MKSSVFYKLLSETDNKIALEKIMSEYLKRPLSVLISEFETDSDISVKSLAKQEEDEIDKIKKKALQHESIQQAQKIFEGKIVDVKVTKKERDA